MKYLWVYVIVALITSILISIGAYFTYGLEEAIIILLTSFVFGGVGGIGVTVILVLISE